MDEPHLDPSLHHSIKHLQKRHHIPPASINVHILDISSRNPKLLPRLRYYSADNGGVDVAVGEEGGHLDIYVLGVG